ncbi:MAG TPA: DNA-processing protein DprA [Caulobacteraceae bacterium]|nr:DNA-processing protein DprA [Caulobacteraceae bacterium]
MEWRLDWLRLARAEAVGPVTFQRLIERYGDPAKALAALPDLARRGGRPAPLAIPSREAAQAELDAGEALGAALLTGDDEAFPRGLAALDPPPPVLWVLGDVALLRRRSVAVVGARIASAAGRRFARELADALGAAGYVVVSGMARGIDAAAHEGALAHGTVAVLGGGPDDVYPPENAALYEQLVRGGAVVSESPPGQVAKAKDFPRRNRIISGLSMGVVVVEAELKSGSLITARLAAEQGREVFAVPGSPLDPRARGANDLIRQGAVLVEGPEDVLRVLDAHPGLGEPERPPFGASVAEEEDAGDDGDGLLRRDLEALLSPTPVPIDELARSVAAPVSRVLAALVELSLAGRADLLPGGLAARS